MFDLEVLGSDSRVFIRQDRIGCGFFPEIALDHERPVGHDHDDLRIESLEFLVVMPQLRHMICAMPSGEAEVKHQQHILLLINI